MNLSKGDRRFFNTLSKAVSIPGRGVELRNHRNEVWRIGSHDWFTKLGLHNPFSSETLALLTSGATVAVISREGEVVQVIALRDCPREGARRTLQFLRSQGVSLAILSGDNRSAVAQFMQEDNDLFSAKTGALLPEDKGRIIAASPNSVYVGDGVNDLLALKSSTLGISVSGGIAETLDASDIVLTDEPLASLALLFRIAKRTRAVIIIALSVSLMYNIGAAYLAASGQITPLLSAFLMPLSSLTIATICYIGIKLRAI